MPVRYLSSDWTSPRKNSSDLDLAGNCAEEEEKEEEAALRNIDRANATRDADENMLLQTTINSGEQSALSTEQFAR